MPPSPPAPSPHPTKPLIDQISPRRKPVQTSQPPTQSQRPYPQPQPQTQQPLPPSDSPGPLLPTAILHALTLTALHFTFTVLTYHQYAQSASLSLLPLLTHKSLPALPVYFVLTYLSRTSAVYLSRASTSTVYLSHARTLLLLAACIALGCRLVKMTNRAGYLKVVERAPGVGVLWVAVVWEMGLWGAVVGVGAVGGWAWWMGYGFA